MHSHLKDDTNERLLSGNFGMTNALHT